MQLLQKKKRIKEFLEENIKRINENLGKLKEQTGLLQTQLNNLEDLKSDPTEITNPLKANVEKYLLSKKK
jgi:hypothetical protein